MKAEVCQTIDEWYTAPQGAIMLIEDRLLAKCPGCDGGMVLNLRSAGKDNVVPSYRLYGWPEAASLKPGVVHHHFGCGWQGRLRDGKWVQSAEESKGS